MFKKLGHWVHDYLYAIHGHSFAFIYRKPPKHYLGFTKEGKEPIVLIPGVYEKWHFLKAIADPLSLKGHPIYVLDHLGYNIKEIPHSAKMVCELINKKKLQNVIIIAHSKGGLVGKYTLAYYDQGGKIKKIIAIASPFGGSKIAKIIPFKSLKEFHPKNEIIKKLQNKKSVNKKIISIYGNFDNHIWLESSCILDGAKNIQVNEYGHHKILFNKEVKNIILAEIES